MPAPQEYRDGAADGAKQVAARAKQLLAWNVTVDAEVLTQLAQGVAEEFGGIPWSDGSE